LARTVVKWSCRETIPTGGNQMTQQELIISSRKNLLIYAERHGVSEACRVFGYSRTTFYKLKEQYLKTGNLAPKVRRKPRMPNELSLSKKKMLLRFVQEDPSGSPQRYAYRFRTLGIQITHQSVWMRLKRFGLNRRYQRLVYLEQLQAQSQPLTERTLRVVKRKCTKIKKGLWPGHIVALDTFYAGNIKGVGRIYQMTGIDLCSRYGWAKLYLFKDQSASIDFVENALIPKFFHNGIEIESVLSDNGSEFTGSKFRQMLIDYDIKHHRIPPGKPIFNAYCERFQRIILEEFYQVAFRKQFFRSLEELQNKLDEYLAYYNFKRIHFGVIKTGALPIDVLRAKSSVLQQRFQKLST
jgi:transposase InsO family protein